MAGEHAELRDIRIDSIERNPHNPRLLFRQDELEELLNSIRIYGVQVPISVYKEGKKYILIDGERRWRCSKKLGRETIPALIQPTPDPLKNLLLMFNIHSLREQWDLLTIALKLPRVIELLEKELGRDVREIDICEKTGLNRGILRRCKLLIDLPQEYKDQILDELHKPKSQQRLTEDFFIEMERALKTVERAFPNIIEDKDRARKVLIRKYQSDVITNVVHFRQLAKIARSKKVGIPDAIARKAIHDILSKNEVSIETAYASHFANAYDEKDLVIRIQTILDGLGRLDAEDIDPDLRGQLKALVKRAEQLLEDDV